MLTRDTATGSPTPATTPTADPRRPRTAGTAGFSMPEAVITITVITIMITAILATIAALQSTQRIFDGQLAAQQVLQEEIATVRATPFPDILQAPANLTGAPDLCELGASGLDTSAQAIHPNSIRERDGREFTITRVVTWHTSGTPATCEATPNDRADMKNTTITVAWDDRDEGTQSMQATVFSSATTEPVTGPQIVVTR